MPVPSRKQGSANRPAIDLLFAKGVVVLARV
jgi:hypothetical protein